MRRSLWISLALAALTLALYAPALRCQFVAFDDPVYVTENRHVQGGLTWDGILWAFHSTTGGNWHPLTMLSHEMDCQLYGLRPWGHHLTNILLHTANTVLLFLLLMRMTRAVWRSACVAALFAVHPAHVESVAWISERKDVLSTFFFLLTIWAYARFVGAAPKSRARRWNYLLTISFFALALLAKPMAVTLPFVLLLLDFWPLGRVRGLDWMARGASTSKIGRALELRTWRPTPLPLPAGEGRGEGESSNCKPSSGSWKGLVWEKLPLLTLSAAFCVITVWAQGVGQAVASAADLSMRERIVHTPLSYFEYLRMLALPCHLAAYYPYQHNEPMVLAIAAGLLLAALTGGCLAAASRRPYLTMGWLWYVGMLVPVIGLVQVGGQGLADRYVYLPSVGLSIAVVWLGAEWAERRPFVKWLVPVWVSALAVMTCLEIPYWHDTRSLFERAMQVTQNNYVAMTLVGNTKEDAGDIDGAMQLYRDALLCKPAYPEAHFFLGRTLDKKRNAAGAKAEYLEAVRLNPDLASAHVMLGMILANENKYDEAIAHYQAALKSEPESAAAYSDWGWALLSQSKWEESIAKYQRALAFDPNLAEAHANLAYDYLHTGRLADGTAELQAALKLNPGDAETRFNLGQALNQQQQWAEAANVLQPVASEASPTNANLQFQFGLALENSGQTREALSHYAKALEVNHDFLEALQHSAWIEATDSQPELRNGTQAVDMATRACELTGQKRPSMLLTLAAAQAEDHRFDEALATVDRAEALAKAPEQKQLVAEGELMRKAFAMGQSFRSRSR